MHQNTQRGPDVATDRRHAAPGVEAGSVSDRKAVIDELEAAMGDHDVASRADALRRVTELFLSGCHSFNEEQVALFDEVMGRLVEGIEEAARAAFGKQIVMIPNAPLKVSRKLALDDSIAVAAALLTHSERLDQQTLIEGAKTKSQSHLFAISKRRILSEDVTDVLVERGDKSVVVSTAGNSGARFSHFGYSTLVTRSKADEELALTVWSRAEVPREHLLRLFETATEDVRRKFQTADRTKAALVRDMVKRAADEIQTQIREDSAEFRAAQQAVQWLHRSGNLTEARLREFAERGKFEETTVALSLLCDMPLGAIERALVDGEDDHILVLAKAIGLSWPTAYAVTQLSARRPSRDPDRCLAKFNKLRVETARTAVKFYRLRERASHAMPH